MRYVALGRVERTMQLQGTSWKVVRGKRIACRGYLRAEPGGITEDTGMDVSTWVAAGYLLPVPEAAPVAAPVAVAEIVAPVEPEPEPEPVAEADPEVKVEARARGRFARKADR